MSSLGSVVVELSQNSLLQQPAYIKGLRPARLPKKAKYAICISVGLEFPRSALTPKAMGNPTPSEHSSQTLDKRAGWPGPLGLAHR